MVDDHGGADQEYTACTLLTILQKHFSLGQPIQAHAACEALCSYMVDMRNVTKFVQWWCLTVLSLHAECYPLIYFDMALNFMCNLPEDGGWYLPLQQEMTRDCGQTSDSIDFGYLDALMDRVIDLDIQWHLLKGSNHSNWRKCDVCSQQSHTMEQHDPSKQCPVKSVPNGHPPNHQPGHPPDKSYNTPRADYADTILGSCQ
ncbi:uncharacterized protein EV420DRAFT_1641639 [Desarmillaria tabescens]|uniref:Uncharacterized protein n=1 Tax=Armillaria tabescens TaxID=1929756 RepID=A0AA39N6R4_ARMTA|nr:uncharacterized protein EV420DRAFT_1641639 [Desarmillaria tabescens]KAK0459454.1 hypothetical protein EV420DRAFT_1641639 [Desarmillaria tabescens]